MNNHLLQSNAPSLTPLDIVDSLVMQLDQRITGHFRGLKLSSAYQPIYSIAHRRLVGYEGLLRASERNGTAISPLALFHSTKNEFETSILDRLCTNLHLRNFMTMSDDSSWIFINISPQSVTSGKDYEEYFSGLLHQYAIPPHRVVVEILEGEIHDEKLLADAVKYYKDLGCLVAIDDFGAGHSNFERIWRIAPDIVKLDRSVINQAAQHRTVARVLPNLVNLIHEAGSLALIEGIETETEALIAMDSGTDFVQGYYFALPAAHLLPESSIDDRITMLCGKIRSQIDQFETQQQRELMQYIDKFKHSAHLIRSGVPPKQACTEFLLQSRTERCFLLNRDGMQSGENIVSHVRTNRDDPRFLPISNAKGANWSRRHYFQNAINNPGEVQTTRPYLSVAEAKLCITLSIAIETGNDTHVFCCDLNWLDN